jgi:hypothetical protein
MRRHIRSLSSAGGASSRRAVSQAHNASASAAGSGAARALPSSRLRPKKAASGDADDASANAT